MGSKVKFTKYWCLAKEYLNTPRKVSVFISMIMWSGFLQLVLLFYPVEKVTRWATQKYWKLTISTNDIIRYLYWLQRLKLVTNNGDCLVISMLHYRFLSMIEENPILFIGFHDDKGHAWVELSGEVISEPTDKSKDFKPVLCLLAGESSLSPVE